MKYFDNVKRVEAEYRKEEDIIETIAAPVVIPLYDDDEDPDDENPEFMEDLLPEAAPCFITLK
jgi:hypothetical protein